MMEEPMKNWKTTLAGGGMLLVAFGHIAISWSHGTNIQAEDVSMIMGAIGLFFAKDASKP